jgi:hypothetical protein
MKPHMHSSPRRFFGAAKSCLLAALLPAALAPLRAQTPPPAPAPAEATADDAATAKLSDADLDDLLGPIALYPDALISLILPASTVPSDITMADRFLQKNGDDANVEDQPWDESVRGLAHYPDVLKWMDDNLEWTTSVGEAFVTQPADVMNSIQRLRLAAKDKGNLVNTPQQTVVVEKPPKAEREVIRIVPTEPDVIYVPQYDPQVVYVESAPVYEPDYTPLLTFGVGFAVGSWLNYDCDWRDDSVYYGPGCGWNNQGRWWNRGWNDGNVNVVNYENNVSNITNVTNVTNNYSGNAAAVAAARQWQPSAASRRMIAQRERQNLGNARIAAASRAARVDARQEHRQIARENRQANRVAAARVPQPSRLTVNANRARANAARREAQARHGQQPANRAPNAATAAKAQQRKQNQAAAHARPGATPNRAHRPATAAPNVNGQAGGVTQTNKPRHTPAPGAPSQNAGRPHSKPHTAAPGTQQANRQKQQQRETAADRPKATHTNAEAQRRQKQNEAARAEQQARQHRQSQAQHAQQQQHNEAAREQQARQHQAQAQRAQQQQRNEAARHQQSRQEHQAQAERAQQQHAAQQRQAQQHRQQAAAHQQQAQAQRQQQQQHHQQAQSGQQQKQQKKKKDQD